MAGMDNGFRGGPGGGMRGMGDAAGSRRRAEDVAQLADRPVSLRRVGRLFAPYRGGLALVVALIVATSVVGLATPFIVRELIDVAIPNHDVPLLLWLVGGLLAIAVVTAVLGVVQTWRSTLIGQSVMHELRTSLFAHLQRLPLDFFTRTRGGEVQSRLSNDITAMQSVVTNAATSIASNVTTAVGTVIAMVVLSPVLSLLSLVVIPPAIWVARTVARLRRSVLAQAQARAADMQTQVEESLSVSGVQLSKSLNAGPRLAARFRATSEDALRLEVASELAGRWRMAIMTIVFAAIPALIYLVAGLPGTGDSVSIGTLVAFTALQAALFRPVLGILSVGVQVTTSMALFSRIFEYQDLPVPIDDPAEPVALDPATARGEVRLDDVTFRYPGADRNALDDVSVTVPPGRTLAVVGHTGSGKSTLAGLVSRLADPTAGAVAIDGVDLRDLTLANVADLVGVVSQDTYLVHASVADNLRYARPDATDEELRAAARAASLDGVIAALPDGYDTMVGSRGHRFSGGERQRMALARTFLRRPRVLVLDEATSALDNETERAVQRAIERLSSGVTTIVIAHRLSTVRDADEIVVLDGGRIVERGSYDGLLSAGGAFAALVRAQDSAGRLDGV